MSRRRRLVLPDRFFFVTCNVFPGRLLTGSLRGFFPVSNPRGRSGKAFREDTTVRFSYLPTLRARLALNDGEASRAIELLQITVPYELGSPRSWHGNFGALYPVYVRGEGYLAAHQGASPPRTSRRFSITAGSWSAIPSVHCTCNSAERSLWREIGPRPRLRTRISSRSGKTPTPKSSSSGKPRRNTPG
jgi:hypothetical protein